MAELLFLPFLGMVSQVFCELMKSQGAEVKHWVQYKQIVYYINKWDLNYGDFSADRDQCKVNSHLLYTVELQEHKCIEVLEEQRLQGWGQWRLVPSSAQFLSEDTTLWPTGNLPSLAASHGGDGCGALKFYRSCSGQRRQKSASFFRSLAFNFFPLHSFLISEKLIILS